MDTTLKEFVIPEDVSHLEIASVNYDQWILTIAVRLYSKSDQTVIGMTHAIFEKADGFRVLNKDNMIRFPWSEFSNSSSFVHEVDNGGWLEMEKKSGNIVGLEDAKEYLVYGSNEAISVIAYTEPKYVAG